MRWFGARRFAAEELRGDKEIVMRAALADAGASLGGVFGRKTAALKYATEELKGDREVVMKVVAQNGLALEHAVDALKGCQEIVEKAVSHCGAALRFATEELRGNREVVMQAVSRDGAALNFATEALRGERAMMERALAQNPRRLLGLKVMLLSGRDCSWIFRHWGYRGPLIADVLRKSAELLELDPEQVVRDGALMSGTDILDEIAGHLEYGRVHEVTLVLSPAETLR